jgi:hypothetical protein
MMTTPENITKLEAGQVFVYGSNTIGHHGGGAAKFAMENFGAVYGNGYGIDGQAYGIPTKDDDINTMSLGDIAEEVKRFIRYAASHPSVQFLVTKIGCGLAGLKEEHIAPMFKNAGDNVVLPEGWRVDESVQD